MILDNIINNNKTTQIPTFSHHNLGTLEDNWTRKRDFSCIFFSGSDEVLRYQSTKMRS